MDSPRALILWTLAMVLLIAMALWIAYLVRDVLLLIYVSALLAIGFSPIVRLIQRQEVLRIGARPFPRWVVILALYVAILGAAAGVAAAISPPLVRQAREFVNELPGMVGGIQDYLVSMGVLERRLTLKEAFARAPSDSTGAVGALAATVWRFVGGIVGIVTIVILTFYFLIEAESLFESLLRLFPAHRRERIAEVSRQITIRVSGWLAGQLTLALAIGTSAALFLWLVGVPYFYVLALIAGIGELIPVVGPILAAVPAVLVGFSVSIPIGLAVGVFYAVQQQIENHVLVPRMMARQVGVSAVTVILALLLGGSLLGIVGAILAVPTAAILQVLFNEVIGSEDGAAAGS